MNAEGVLAVATGQEGQANQDRDKPRVGDDSHGEFLRKKYQKSVDVPNGTKVDAPNGTKYVLDVSLLPMRV